MQPNFTGPEQQQGAPDLSGLTGPSRESFGPEELARERVHDFNDSLFRVELEERAKLTREFYASLTSSAERAQAAHNLGGARYYRIQIPHETALEVLQPLLADSDPVVQVEALAACERLEASELNSARVMELSNSSDSGVRLAALRAMRGGRDAAFETRLSGALSEPEPEARWTALRVLAQILPDDRAAALLDDAFEDPSPQVRMAAIDNLAPLAFRGYQDLVDKLIVRTHDVDREVVGRAMHALSGYSPALVEGPAALGNALASKLLSEDPGLRASAGCGLAHLRASHYFPQLLKHLRDPGEDVLVRRAIVTHLHGGDSGVFAAALEELLQEPEIDAGLRWSIEHKLDYWRRGIH